MPSYKTEWVEPSYGCCYMSKTDHEIFNQYSGNIDQIFAFRSGLLKKYRSQYPFQGDGKLYEYKNWTEYENSLPRIVNTNSVSQEEKKTRGEIIDLVSVQSSDYTNILLGSISSASAKLKQNSSKLFESKTSGSRRKNDGVTNNTGNNLMGTSVIITSEIDECAKEISEEFQAAKTKAESALKAKISAKLASAKAKMTAKYASIKASLQAYKAQIAAFKAQIAVGIAAISGKLAALQKALVAQAKALQAALAAAQAAILKNLENTLDDALDAITGGFAGLAALITTPVGFAAVAIQDAGVVLSSENAYISTCTTDYRTGTPYECEGVAVGRYNGYKARCFKPKNLSTDEIINAAKKEAQDFASENNGSVWNDCKRKRFVVFYE